MNVHAVWAGDLLDAVVWTAMSAKSPATRAPVDSVTTSMADTDASALTDGALTRLALSVVLVASHHVN